MGGRTLAQFCKHEGIDFGDYIEYVMDRMVSGEKYARSLIPNHVHIPANLVLEGRIDTRESAKIS